MRKVVAVLLVVVAFTAAAKNKNKVKEKRFEPVSVEASMVVGSYRGPSDAYHIALELHDGTLRGSYLEQGRDAVLTDIDIDEDRFTALARFHDGSTRTIRGSFAMRVLNGVTAFGLRVVDLPLQDMGVIHTFFEKEQVHTGR